ncbi:hypothetical protein BDZ91DRAFT_795825 [Kalaharituber pfeilii]|nr:hypothetical protein BDZ91DRAFT_795825 [Kalaharituber pfeilii]
MSLPTDPHLVPATAPQNAPAPARPKRKFKFHVHHLAGKVRRLFKRPMTRLLRPAATRTSISASMTPMISGSMGAGGGTTEMQALQGAVSAGSGSASMALALTPEEEAALLEQNFFPAEERVEVQDARAGTGKAKKEGQVKRVTRWSGIMGVAMEGFGAKGSRTAPLAAAKKVRNARDTAMLTGVAHQSGKGKGKEREILDTDDALLDSHLMAGPSTNRMHNLVPTATSASSHTLPKCDDWLMEGITSPPPQVLPPSTTPSPESKKKSNFKLFGSSSKSGNGNEGPGRFQGATVIAYNPGEHKCPGCYGVMECRVCQAAGSNAGQGGEGGAAGREKPKDLKR